MKFNEKLKNLRSENNETQMDLANYLNITFQSVSKWEKGICLPSIEIIKDIANHYNVSLDSLLLDYEPITKIETNKENKVKKIYHPTINEESYFCVFLDKGKHKAFFAENRYRTPVNIPQRASNIKNNYVIAVNEQGKIIYLSKSTGYGYGSPCDKYYHRKDVTEAKNIDCFHLLPTYAPYGDGTNHYFDWEFIIPNNGFVIIIAENSLEFKTIFQKYQFNEFYYNFPIGCLDELTLKINDNVLEISYEEDNKNKLKNSISKDVLETLFKEYIKNNKHEIIQIIKEQIFDDLESHINESSVLAQEAFDLAQEAFDLAQQLSERE